MKGLTSSLLRYFFLLGTLVLGWHCPLAAQDVPDDARRLADALRASNVWVQVTPAPDATVGISQDGVQLREVSQDAYTFGLGVRETYKLQGAGALLIRTAADTLWQGELPEATHTITHFPEAVKLEVANEAVQYLPKSSFFTIYRLLGAYSGLTDLSPAALPEVIRNYQGNPFLAPLFNDGDLAPAASDAELQAVFAVSAQQQAAAVAQYDEAADYLQGLANDSLFANQYTGSIQDVKAAYESPAIGNKQALNDLATGIQIRYNRSGANDFTSVVLAGLSDFLVERAQEEFNISFMERFRARMAAAPELGALFPQTSAFMGGLDVANYRSALSSAREFFVTDLNNLGFNLPNLLALPKYAHLANQPEIYNLITVYSMFDMAIRGVSVDSLLPLTYHRLVDRRQELEKGINLAIADSLWNQPVYHSLTDSTDALASLLDSLHREVGSRQSRLLAAFPRLVVQTSGDTALTERTRELYFRAKSDLLAFRDRYQTDRDSLTVIAAYLRGQYNYAFLEDRAQLDQFDKYFAQPPNPVQLRGAGLALTRRLVGQSTTLTPKATLLDEWNRAIRAYQAEVQTLRDLIRATQTRDGLLLRQLDSIDQKRQAFYALLLTDRQFWAQQPDVAANDTAALSYLAAIVRSFEATDVTSLNPLTFTYDSTAMLANRRQLLRGVTAKAEVLVRRLNDTYQPQQFSPLLFYFLQQQTSPATPSDPLQVPLGRARALSDEVRSQLSHIDQSYYGIEARALQNATVFSNVVDLTNRMLSNYLVNDPNQKWLSGQQYHALMGDPVGRSMFLGLVYQRLRSTPLAPNLSGQGIGLLGASFAAAVGDITLQLDSIHLKRDQQQPLRFRDYYPLVAALAGLVNSVLETPLFVQPAQGAAPAQQLSLVQLNEYSRLRYAPGLTNQLLGLLDDVSQGRFRFAISNLVGLTDTLSLLIENSDGNAGSELRRNLLTYGNFIADVAGATRPDDVNQALRNVALPPGSSRTKRIVPFDVTLNGYFGGAFGRETLEGEAFRLFPFNSFSLSVPVGMAFSFQLCHRCAHSFSLFLPIIDLGALTAYRVQTNFQALPKLTFSNVIAPGIFGHINFGRSPFYLGAGWQFGPQVREFEDATGATVERSASRVLLTFGIDVPIFNFYRAEQR